MLKKGVEMRSPKNYVKVNLPKYLADVIDTLVKEGRYGYKSRDEFVADAVRRRLEQLGYLK